MASELPEETKSEEGRDSEETVIPVVAEQLNAGVRKVPVGGVRVQKHVSEREEVIEQPLRREEVEVRRIVKNQVVDGPLATRQEGNVTIIPVVKEVLKIEKQWVLVEEYHLIKKQFEGRDRQRVVLREEQAEVERIGAGGESLGPATEMRPAPAPPTRQRGVEPEPFTERLRARRNKEVK